MNQVSDYLPSVYYSDDDDDLEEYYSDLPPIDMTERLREINRELAEDVTPIEGQRVQKLRFKEVIAEFQSPRDSDTDDGYGDSSDLICDNDDDNDSHNTNFTTLKKQESDEKYDEPKIKLDSKENSWMRSGSNSPLESPLDRNKSTITAVSFSLKKDNDSESDDDDDDDIVEELDSYTSEIEAEYTVKPNKSDKSNSQENIQKRMNLGEDTKEISTNSKHKIEYNDRLNGDELRNIKVINNIKLINGSNETKRKLKNNNSYYTKEDDKKNTKLFNHNNNTSVPKDILFDTDNSKSKMATNVEDDGQDLCDEINYFKSRTSSTKNSRSSQLKDTRNSETRTSVTIDTNKSRKPETNKITRLNSNENLREVNPKQTYNIPLIKPLLNSHKVNKTFHQDKQSSTRSKSPKRSRPTSRNKHIDGYDGLPNTIYSSNSEKKLVKAKIPVHKDKKPLKAVHGQQFMDPYQLETKEYHKTKVNSHRKVKKASSTSDLRSSYDDRPTDQSNRVYESWLVKKNREATLQKKKEEEEKSLQLKENTAKLQHRRQMAEEAFQHWLRRKRDQLRMEKRLTREQKKLEREVQYTKTRNQCEEAYHEWFNKKQEEMTMRRRTGNTSVRSSSLERSWVQEKTRKLYTAYVAK